MPIIFAALLVILLIVLASVLLIPVTLIQRYRAGTARRRVRPWLATINSVGIGLSLTMLVVGAAFTNIWVPQAFVYAIAGAISGLALGMLGLAVTRWDRAGGAWYYQPNRWLVLAITLAVTARIAYGFWRSWNAYQAFAGDTAWIAASGVAGSLAAGALILGYYLTYWLGIRRRS